MLQEALAIFHVRLFRKTKCILWDFKMKISLLGIKAKFTMANFFAPLQLICRSFVFIVFLLEFFCNIFVILKQNIYRQILLFAFKNFVCKYKIIAKVNFLINPFAKKLQVLQVQIFQNNCIIVQNNCNEEKYFCKIV